MAPINRIKMSIEAIQRELKVLKKRLEGQKP